jgi:hypothetical protein
VWLRDLRPSTSLPVAARGPLVINIPRGVAVVMLEMIFAAAEARVGQAAR